MLVSDSDKTGSNTSTPEDDDDDEDDDGYSKYDNDYIFPFVFVSPLRLPSLPLIYGMTYFSISLSPHPNYLFVVSWHAVVPTQ